THVFFCVSKNVSVSCAYTQGKREQFSGFNRTLDAINNVFRKFSAFHDETGRLNVDGMNIISNDGSNKLNRSRKARVSYKVQRTINASLNAATSTRAVSSNPNFVTRQKMRSAVGFLLRSLIMFQTFISRHNSNFFSDKLVLTSVTPASSAPVLQTPKATSSTLYFDSLT